MQQTVNFQCGHCGKLMAVGVEFLGQQVRCPHCQQVVLAPAANAPAAFAPAAPAPESAPAPLPAEDPFRTLTVSQNEDIFAKNEPEDALFGQEGPRLEIPRDIVPSAPAQAFDMPLETTTASPPPVVDPTLPTVSITPPTVNEFGEAPRPGPNEPDTMLWPPAGVTTEPPVSGLESPVEGMGAIATTSVRKHRDDAERINWFIPLVFIPLVLYAVLATAAAGFLYLRIQSRPPSLWEQFPDVDGDTPGVRSKPRGGVNLRFNREEALKSLPEQLHVKLGENLRLGDLEVTPLTVRRQRVKIFTEGFDQSEPCPYDSLVLTLKFRNLAEGYAFTPLDNYFDRHWDHQLASVPLTVLAAGRERFFGGPAKWFPLKQDVRTRERREWVDLPGRKNVDLVGLAPGESTETCTCTDGADPAVAAHLFGVNDAGKRVRNPWSGKLLWRVQVRRGMIEYKGQNRPAAAVIGVDFSSTDYTN
jgi:hypothetical protein